MCSARWRASSLTQPRSAEPLVCCHGSRALQAGRLAKGRSRRLLVARPAAHTVSRPVVGDSFAPPSSRGPEFAAGMTGDRAAVDTFPAP
jgi:hypothetical protein